LRGLHCASDQEVKEAVHAWHVAQKHFFWEYVLIRLWAAGLGVLKRTGTV
jgi:hypothetical protein